jgi:hypothetical protein
MPDQGPPIWRTGAGAGRSLVLLGTPPATNWPVSALRAVRPSEGLSPPKAPPALPTAPVKRHPIRLATRDYCGLRGEGSIPVPLPPPEMPIVQPGDIGNRSYLRHG